MAVESATTIPRRAVAARRRGRFLDYLLRFVLSDFFRSPWPLVIAFVLAGVHILFFSNAPDRQDLFTALYGIVGLVAAIAGAAIFGRANRAETRSILARAVPRSSYLLALLLASWLVAIAAYLFSLLAVVIRYGGWLPLDSSDPPLSWLDAAALLTGSVSALAVSAFAVSLVALLSPLVSSQEARLVVLALLALFVMSFDSRNFPIVEIRPVLERLPPVLAPVAGALKYATGPAPDNVATISLLLLTGYALFLWLLVITLFSTRELAFE